MITQRRSKRIEIELFKEFININDTLRDFLTVGLLSSEIFNFFESLHREIIHRKAIQGVLYRKTPEIYHIDPDSIARDIAGYQFGLKKGKGGRYKRRGFWADVYYIPPGTKLARVYYEIVDSQLPSFPVRLLSAINDLDDTQPPTEKQIREHMVKVYGYKWSNAYQQIKRWLPRLVRKGYIRQNNGINETYYLPIQVKINFHRDIQNTWVKIKDWPYRKIFYPR